MRPSREPITWAERALPRSELASTSLVLMAASAVTGLLGLVFWTVTAWGFPAAEVGRAAAIISSATMLAAFSSVGLGQMYERFLAVGGRRVRGFITTGHVVVTATALALGTAFALAGPAGRLFATPAEAVAFPLWVALLAVFAVQDQMLIGLQAARWMAVKNVVHAVLKLALVAVFAWSASSGTSVVLAWMAATVVVAAGIQLAVSRRWLSRLDGSEPRLPATRMLWRYFAGSSALALVGCVTPFVVPLIVVHRLDTAANAYFNAAWTLFAAIVLVLNVLTGPYVAKAAAEPALLADLTRRLIRLQALVSVGGGVGLAVLGPVMLGVMGADYAAAAGPLTRWLALSLPLVAVGAVFSALCRAQRRLRPAVVTRSLATAVIVAGSVVAVGGHGIVVIGWSYLLAEAVAAACVAVPLARRLTELRQPSATPAMGAVS